MRKRERTRRVIRPVMAEHQASVRGMRQQKKATRNRDALTIRGELPTWWHRWRLVLDAIALAIHRFIRAIRGSSSES